MQRPEPSPNERADVAYIRELRAKLADRNAQLADRNAQLADRNAQLTDRDAQLADRDAQLADRDAQLVVSEGKRAKLKDAYDALLRELALMKRRIFVATAERLDTSELQLEFDALLKQLDVLAKTEAFPQSPEGDAANGSERPRTRRKPKGRRNLADADLPETRIEIADPTFETLVAAGKAKRIGFETSSQLGWQTGGPRRVVTALVKYKVIDAQDQPVIATAPRPKALLARCLAAPSMLAYLLVAKYSDGLPFNRVSEILKRHDLRLDRGTMSRWSEDLGATLDATVVEAMRRDARANAFCIAADATGIKVQPTRRPKEKGGRRKRRACGRGHYMVMIADRAHIWFEYTRRETSDAVAEMFEGYSGYVQVDAKSVFDVLFRPESEDDPPSRVEVGCWAHARRKFWEASLAGSETARQALARISRMFSLESAWSGASNAERTRLRQLHQKVHVQSFMAWAAAEYEAVGKVRGPLRTALGYIVRQEEALSAFLQHGRLRMDNNPAELALRGRVAVGRKAWLFVGSDGHAQSAAGIMSLIASARLHQINPQTYLQALIRVLPYWPRDRYLELAPLHWADTRSRLDSSQLTVDVGPVTVPQRHTPPPEQ